MKNRRLKLEHLDAELRHIESALDEGRDRKGLVDRELSTVRASVHGESHFEYLNNQLNNVCNH